MHGEMIKFCGVWFSDSSILKTLLRFGSCHALQDIDYMRYTYLNCLRFGKSEYHVFLQMVRQTRQGRTFQRHQHIVFDVR